MISWFFNFWVFKFNLNRYDVAALERLSIPRVTKNTGVFTPVPPPAPVPEVGAVQVESSVTHSA